MPAAARIACATPLPGRGPVWLRALSPCSAVMVETTHLMTGFRSELLRIFNVANLRSSANIAARKHNHGSRFSNRVDRQEWLASDLQAEVLGAGGSRHQVQQALCIRMERPAKHSRRLTPFSTARPAYITATRSANPASKAGLWVMNNRAVPNALIKVSQDTPESRPVQSRPEIWSARPQ